MDPAAFDPYEQQLYAVFNSYDSNNTGTLDHEGFSQLCSTLQLEERRPDLMFYLFDSTGKKSITFYEFKDALLAMLGEDTAENETTVNDDESPDREVSPKYVYGAKKYGRRSRPRAENDKEDLKILLESELTSPDIKVNKIQRSNSQSDCQPSKKRKGNTQLKRCTSFPNATNYSLEKISGSPTSQCEIERQMASELWKRLDIGKNGTLNSKELKLVIDYIGSDKISDNTINQLHSRLNLSEDKQLSFNSFLELFHSCDMFRSDDQTNQMLTESETFQKSTFTQFISLSKDGSGVINADIIADMWESAGISSAHSLLSDLGFTQHEINITKLATTIEEELRNINGGLNQISVSTNPHLALLQASLSLYQLEVRCLKSAIEHLNAERDKLRSDVNDANHRANLLAQEVDDNHARMEKKTKEHVKLLEQRHADMIRDLTQQLSNEREQASFLNHKLEQRIASLEAEEMRLKMELADIQHDIVDLEKENRSLLEQISRLEETNTQLLLNVTTLEGEKQEISAMEGTKKDEQMLSYLEKISSLQTENTALKDKNDELCSELESLNAQLAALQVKKSCSDLSVSIVDPLGNAIKDTSSQNLSDQNNSAEEENLSHTKLPKCHVKSNVRELPDGSKIMPFNSNDTGLDIDYDYVDSSVSIASSEGGNDEEIQRLQARVSHLEQLLANYGHVIPSEPTSKPLAMDNENCTEKQLVETLKGRCKKLELILQDTKSTLQTILSDRDCDVHKCIAEIHQKLFENVEFMKNLTEINATESTTTTDSNSNNCDNSENQKNEFERLQAENKELKERCHNLETSLELLRVEYEHCEDYWANKLDEERQLFDQEQRQSNANFQELLNKMTELEEQFQAQDNKLPVIQENSFEKQYTELEEDFESYRRDAEEQLESQQREIEDLKLVINNLKQKIDVSNAETQTITRETSEKEINTDTELSQNIFSTFTWTKNSSASDNSFTSAPDNPVQNPLVHRTRKHNTSSADIAYRKDEIKRLRNIKSQLDAECQALHKQKESLIKEVIDLKNKIKGSEEPIITYKWKGMRGFTNMNSGKQVCRVSISTLQELNARMHELDQKCRHLQHVLRKNQQQTENMLHQCWLQHKGEVTDLQYLLKTMQEKLECQTQLNNEQIERLARSDMLVKDLYIENSYLVATVQRLEHHCHMLSQYNNKTNPV